MSHKIQGVHEILIGPVGQFQSVTKVKGSKSSKGGPRTRKNVTLVVTQVFITMTNSPGGGRTDSISSSDDNESWSSSDCIITSSSVSRDLLVSRNHGNLSIMSSVTDDACVVFGVISTSVTKKREGNVKG